MLKRTIKYTDFNDNKVEEVFYFNLTKPELLELELSEEGGFGDSLRRIIETRNNQALVAEFKRLILSAYGQKSEDGKRFIKNDTIRQEFEQSAAYEALFMELATNDRAAADFIKGIVPADMSMEIEKEIKQSSLPRPSTPPPPPPAA